MTKFAVFATVFTLLAKSSLSFSSPDAAINASDLIGVVDYDIADNVLFYSNGTGVLFRRLQSGASSSNFSPQSTSDIYSLAAFTQKNILIAVSDSQQQVSAFDIQKTTADGTTIPKLIGKLPLSRNSSSNPLSWATKFMIKDANPINAMCYVTSYPQRDIVKIWVNSDYDIYQTRISLGTTGADLTNEVDKIGLNSKYMLVPIMNKNILFRITLSAFATNRGT